MRHLTVILAWLVTSCSTSLSTMAPIETQAEALTARTAVEPGSQESVWFEGVIEEQGADDPGYQEPDGLVGQNCGYYNGIPNQYDNVCCHLDCKKCEADKCTTRGSAAKCCPMTIFFAPPKCGAVKNGKQVNAPCRK